MKNYVRMGILALAVSLQVQVVVAAECVKKQVRDIGIDDCDKGVIEDMRNSTGRTPPIIIKGQKDQAVGTGEIHVVEEGTPPVTATVPRGQ